MIHLLNHHRLNFNLISNYYCYFDCFNYKYLIQLSFKTYIFLKKFCSLFLIISLYCFSELFIFFFINFIFHTNDKILYLRNKIN